MNSPQLPFYVLIVQAIGPTVVAVVAAVIASVIQWRQWRISKDKVAIDLFEKRMIVHNAALHFLSEFVRNGTATSEQIDRLHNARIDGRYLFSEAISDWLWSIEREALEAARLGKERERMPKISRTAKQQDRLESIVKEEQLIFDAMQARLHSLEARFHSWMSFSHIRTA